MWIMSKWRYIVRDYRRIGIILKLATSIFCFLHINLENWMDTVVILILMSVLY